MNIHNRLSRLEQRTGHTDRRTAQDLPDAALVAIIVASLTAEQLSRTAYPATGDLSDSDLQAVIDGIL